MLNRIRQITSSANIHYTTCTKIVLYGKEALYSNKLFCMHMNNTLRLQIRLFSQNSNLRLTLALCAFK